MDPIDWTNDALHFATCGDEDAQTIADRGQRVNKLSRKNKRKAAVARGSSGLETRVVEEEEKENPPGRRSPSLKRARLNKNTMNAVASNSKLMELSSSSASSSKYLMGGHTGPGLASSSSSVTLTGSGSLSSTANGTPSSSLTTITTAKSPSIASLCNLGNTCFLNSVLYTLRFTPGFLHNLHHMVADLTSQQQLLQQQRQHQLLLLQQQQQQHSHHKKRPGLSNGISSISSSSMSNGHDAIELQSSEDDELVHDVIERLHDLFKTLSLADETQESSREAIAPSSFLNAVGKLNPLFEGNKQQDAHELLVMILNILEDIKITTTTTTMLSNAASSSSLLTQETGEMLPPAPPPPLKGGKSKKGSSSSKRAQSSSNNLAQNGIGVAGGKSYHSLSTSDISGGGRGHHRGSALQQKTLTTTTTLPNFVKENFEGKSVMTTKCLECEQCSYRPETFTNIDVPLHFDSDEDSGDDKTNGQDLFLKQIMKSETLRENNKYWCEVCSRLNEAQRSVKFELLPKVMVLQLKRFTTAASSVMSSSSLSSSSKSHMSKIIDYIPTPFTMNCFCIKCMPNYGGPKARGAAAAAAAAAAAEQPKHSYRLYAVIMHLGATLASGHYIAYVKANSDYTMWDYLQCQRVSSAGGGGGGGGGSSSSQQVSNHGGGSVPSNEKLKNGNGKKGILKFLRRGGGNSAGSESKHSSQHHNNNSHNNGDVSVGHSCDAVDSSSTLSSSCRSVDCCGIRIASGASNSSNGSSGSSHLLDSNAGSLLHQQRSLDSTDSTATDLVNGVGCSASSSSSSSVSAAASSISSMSLASSAASTADEVWLECDDENIQVISRKKLEHELLSKRQEATTPYLLFYQKVV